MSGGRALQYQYIKINGMRSCKLLKELMNHAMKYGKVEKQNIMEDQTLPDNQFGFMPNRPSMETIQHLLTKHSMENGISK